MHLKIALVNIVSLLYLLCLFDNSSQNVFQSTHLVELLNEAEDGAYKIILRNLEKEKKELTKFMTEYENFKEVKILGSYNPINAFHVIQRWLQLQRWKGTKKIQKSFVKNSKFDRLNLATENDLKGMARAILRIQRMHKLKTISLSKGKLFDETTKPFSHEDQRVLGQVAEEMGDMGLAAQWFKAAAQNTTDDDEKAGYFYQVARMYKKMENHIYANAYMLKAFELDWETPEHKKNIIDYGLTATDDVLSHTVMKSNMYTWQPERDALWREYERLCRGIQDQEFITKESRLYCRYKPGIVPYVVYKEEILSTSPKISFFYDVMTKNESEHFQIEGLAEMNKAPITQTIGTNDDKGFKMMWLWDNRDAIANDLSKRIGQITELETELTDLNTNSEPFQVHNYGAGGQFLPHTDFFMDPEHQQHEPEYLQNTGNRFVTVLLHFGKVLKGGATVFPAIGVRAPPEENGALVWSNAVYAGQNDPRTLNAACPVVLGYKWVAYKWMRAHGQMFKAPCPVEIPVHDSTM